MTQMTRRFVVGAVALAACAGLAALPEVSEEAVAALGVTTGTPQMNGFVFVDGKYLPPPYTVTRRGNGIFINRIQVVQPVPWVGAAAADAPKKALDEDGDFEVVEEEEEGEAAEAEAAGQEELLFGDADDGAKGGAHAIDALFDDVAAPKKKAPERKAAPPQPTAEVMSKQQVQELKGKLDALRKSYEVALGRGEVYFFAQQHSRVNGTYGSAKTLFGVLPAALRAAQSPQDLMARLQQGGVYFLDAQTCADLYKNRTSFMQLDERRKQIEADEAAKRAAAGRLR